MMSWQMAEELAAEHMRQMGFLEVRRAGDGPDGGVDVWGQGVIAQVKHWATPVGIAEVQRLRGTLRHGNALFYSHAGYTKAATEWASANHVALFSYDQANNVTPLNGAADVMFRHGPIEDIEIVKALWKQITLQAKRCTIASLQLPQAAINFLNEEPLYVTESRVNEYQDHMNRLKSFQDHLNERILPYTQAEAAMPAPEMRELLGTLQEWEDTIIEFWGPARDIMLEDSDFFWVDGDGWYLKNGVTEDKKTPKFSKAFLPPKIRA